MQTVSKWCVRIIDRVLKHLKPHMRIALFDAVKYGGNNLAKSNCVLADLQQSPGNLMPRVPILGKPGSYEERIDLILATIFNVCVSNTIVFIAHNFKKIFYTKNSNIRIATFKLICIIVPIRTPMPMESYVILNHASILIIFE